MSLSDDHLPPLTGDGRDGFPAKGDFNAQMDDYLLGLNPKKRAKALMTEDMYGTILSVLLEPHSTAYATAQFRFWSKRMFRLVTTPHANIVTHENRPVAVKDQIYSILVGCHGDAAHGGRDKTSAQVRRFYSWIPKELVSRFVKMCPHCIAKRRNQKPYFSDSFMPMGADFGNHGLQREHSHSVLGDAGAYSAPESPTEYAPDPHDSHQHASYELYQPSSASYATFDPHCLNDSRPHRSYSVESGASSISTYDSSSSSSLDDYPQTSPIRPLFDDLASFNYDGSAAFSGMAIGDEPLGLSQDLELWYHYGQAGTSEAYGVPTDGGASSGNVYSLPPVLGYDTSQNVDQQLYEDQHLHWIQNHNASAASLEGEEGDVRAARLPWYAEEAPYQSQSLSQEPTPSTSDSDQLHYRRGAPKPPPLDLGRSSNLLPNLGLLRLSSAGLVPPAEHTHSHENEGPFSAPPFSNHLFPYQPLPSPLSACSSGSLSSTGYSLPMTPSTSLFPPNSSANDHSSWQQTSKDLALAIQNLIESSELLNNSQTSQTTLIDIPHHQCSHPLPEDTFSFTGSDLKRERERTRTASMGLRLDSAFSESSFGFGAASGSPRERERTRTRTMSAGPAQSPLMYPTSAERRGSASHILDACKSALRTPRREESRYSPY